METPKEYTFTFTIKTTRSVAEKLFDIIVAITEMLGLELGGGFAPEAGDENQTSAPTA